MTTNVESITLEELSARIDRSAPLRLFEVLPEAHHASGHIPGAIAMPLDRIGEVAARFAPEAGGEIVVYCASATCQSSHIAASKLTELGYRAVRVFAGGKAEWKQAGKPLEVGR